MNRNWNEQYATAARQYDNACDCCDHGPRNAAPERVTHYVTVTRYPEDYLA